MGYTSSSGTCKHGGERDLEPSIKERLRHSMALQMPPYHDAKETITSAGAVSYHARQNEGDSGPVPLIETVVR